ncbi:hypothetical protein [Aurantivibrio plasticivorans]
MRKIMYVFLCPLYIFCPLAIAQLSDEEKLATPEAIISAERSASDDSLTARTQADQPVSTSVLYRCHLRNLERRVEVEYSNTPSPLPCSVKYYKDTEAPGTEQTLWSAVNTIGYCEKKANEMAERLEELGWACDAR